MTTHVKVVAVLFIAFGVLGALAAMFSSLLFGVLAAIVGAQGGDAHVGAALLGFTGAALTIVLLVLSLPSIVCGWGLLGFRRWARILGIILAALFLIRFPLGTIFGVYALWVLFQREAETLLVQ